MGIENAVPALAKAIENSSRRITHKIWVICRKQTPVSDFLIVYQFADLFHAPQNRKRKSFEKRGCAAKSQRETGKELHFHNLQVTIGREEVEKMIPGQELEDGEGEIKNMFARVHFSVRRRASESRGKMLPVGGQLADITETYKGLQMLKGNYLQSSHLPPLSLWPFGVTTYLY